jgi:beta-glucosidase
MSAFPKSFIWGAAAASYQIEGAFNEDGRGLSVWDAFCRQEGAIFNGESGDIACDHYHRYKEDVGIMAEMGLKAYRLSISWPRVMPQGIGGLNAKGMDFYDRLINELLKQGIEPFVTLFHWDYPYALYQKGGWLNPESPDWFAEYAGKMVDKFSDRVTQWITLNEPQCFVGLGHLSGVHAPGLKLSVAQFTTVLHHSVLAHGKAAQAIRAHARQKPMVGIAPVGHAFRPLTPTPENIEAARKMTFAVLSKDTSNISMWMDPIMFGAYPQDGLNLLGQYLPGQFEKDIKAACQPLDFCGMNVYNTRPVRVDEKGEAKIEKFPEGFPYTAFRWPMTPDSLYWPPRFYFERYKIPIYITENGMSNDDWVSLDGKVHDPQRIDFTARYLRSLRQAVQDGVDIKGYFHWSIMDNFEWGKGYQDRFGLIFVDYATQKRIWKDSAFWYKKIIATNGAALD